ncbi:MAG TPA: radical SAM protein [Gemmatimonadaceae bacterium]|nr:radical SAM protein [Gemmatimonadaceae bacterium]
MAQQLSLFPDGLTRRRALPVIGEQKDIRYHATRAREILNGPGTTGLDGFWSINPYVGCAFGCAYCYARYAHRYALERALAADPGDEALHETARTLPPWLAFERAILVKRNAADVLQRTLWYGADRYRDLARGHRIVIGTATDPYQPAERRFRITRGLLEVLAHHADLHVVIITKSPLVTRDTDLLARLARRSSVEVHVSLITVDRELARRIEPRAPTPEARLRAVARLHAAGVRVRVNAMPVLPGITDDPAQLEALVARVAAAGADAMVVGSLSLHATARQRYLPFIAREFPALAARYRATFARGHAMGPRYRRGLAACARELCARYGLTFGNDETAEAADQTPSRAARRSQYPASEISTSSARPSAPCSDA